MDAGEQLQVRYVASSGSCEVQLPGNPAWSTVSFDSLWHGTFPVTCDGCGSGNIWLTSEIPHYSRLLSWFDGGSYGIEAIGIATPAGGVPITGSASYSGQLLGETFEEHSDGSDLLVDGSILLSFNFGLGSLSGSITPNLHQTFNLGTIDFRDTIYSTGSLTFSGRFDTNAAGSNSFSGRFAGPNAQELIGNFSLPYTSPIDGLAYQVDGAFIAQ